MQKKSGVHKLILTHQLIGVSAPSVCGGSGLNITTKKQTSGLLILADVVEQ